MAAPGRRHAGDDMERVDQLCRVNCSANASNAVIAIFHGSSVPSVFANNIVSERFDTRYWACRLTDPSDK